MSVTLDLALDLLAVSEEGLHEPALRACLADRGEPVTPKLLAELLARSPARADRARVSLPREQVEPRVRRCIHAGTYTELASAVARHDPPADGWHGYIVRDGLVRRELRRAVVAGDWERFREVASARRPPIAPLVMRPFEAELIARCPEPLAAVLLDVVLSTSFAEMEPVPGLLEAIAARAAGASGGRMRDLGVLVELLAGRLPSRAGDSTAGLVALARGDVKGSVAAYAKALAEHRKAAGRRDVLAPGLEGLFLPLAYLVEGSPSRKKQALGQLALRPASVSGPYGGWAYLEAWAEPSRRSPPARTADPHPVAVLQRGLAQVWSAEEPERETIEAARARAAACGFHWLADELGALIGERPERPGLQALVTLRRSTARWESLLEAVSGLLDGPTGDEETRIRWRVNLRNLDLSAWEQQRRRGRWTDGKRISGARMRGQGAPVAWTDADLRILACYRSVGGSFYDWVVPDVFVALSRHPHVGGPADEPLTFVERRPRLVIERDAQHVTLRVHPFPKEDVMCEVVGHHGVEITAFDPTQAAVARELAAGLRVPRARQARLDELVARLGERFEAPDDGATDVPGDSGPVVQIWPEGERHLARVVARPAGPAGPALDPGVGPEIVLGVVDGRARRARRDLAEERARAEALWVAVPAVAPSYTGGVAGLPTLESVLAALAELQERGVAVEWPKGGELRVRAGGKLSVAVRRTADWFAVSGELAVDAELALPMRELLERVSAAGRFVRLDDGTWLALTEELRQRLDAVARASRARGDAVEVHPLAAELVEDLLERADHSKVDPAWRRRVAALAEVAPAPVPADLRAELRPYQVDGFRWLARLAGAGISACLADDMGLGKTVTALALLLHRASEGPALVVAPTSVCAGWRAEAWRFAPSLSVRLVSDGASAASLPELGPGELVIASYGVVVGASDAFGARAWGTLVLDEAQALKNAETQRHKAVARLQAPVRVALTGTPLENHLGDLWSLFALLHPGLFGPYGQFQRRFAVPIENGDRAVQQQLHRLVRPLVLRRTKAAVLPDLPPRTVVDVRVDLSPGQAALYDAARREAAAASEGADAVQLLAQLTRLRLLACHPALVAPEAAGVGSGKLEAFAEIVESLAANHHRALVFSQFVRHLALVRDQLDAAGIPYQYLDGETPARERQARVDAFQRGEGRLFLISLRAGGFGLNLTAADYVVHLDPWWNPAVEDQASDRAHRIGQIRPVTVYRLVARGTIEERILELHHTKRELADRLLEGTDAATRLGRDELLELLTA